MTPFDSPGTDDGRKHNFADYLPPLTTATWITVAVGVVVGFTLGLIIAWGIFPVQWTNAWPGDLTQEARAQYLAAVAESYVYYGDEQAAEIARNRLFDLNENLAEEIADAQAYFLDNPQRNARVYVSNLGQLAQALNVDSPDIIVDAPAEEAGAETGAVVPQPADGSVSDSVRAWVNWTLTLLAAVLLVGGGIYIIGRLNQRRRSGGVDYVEDDEPGGFEDETPHPGAPGRNPFMRPAGAAPGRSMAGTAVGPTRGPSSGQTRTQDEYGFEDEDDDDIVYSQGRTLTQDAPGDEAYPADRYEPRAPHDEPRFDAPFEEDDEEAGYDRASVAAADYEADYDVDYDVDYDDEEFDEAYIDAPQSDARRNAAVADDLAAEDEDEIIDEPLVSASAPSRAARRAPAELPALYTFTVHYQAGMLDYDQSYSILNPEGGRYIGDCGMGINMKNGVLQNDPESVIALDVWLVDKKQEKSYSSQTRVLISEYVVDHNLENAFTRERPNDPSPFVPHPGTKFQLRGPSLLLDCEVLEADYIPDGKNAGIFQNLKIDMTVRSLD